MFRPFWVTAETQAKSQIYKKVSEKLIEIADPAKFLDFANLDIKNDDPIILGLSGESGQISDLQKS